jgi:hypothetical protein
MKTKELIVLTVGIEQKSKLNEFKYHFCTFKSTDANDKKKYVLNVQRRDDTKRGAENYKNWMSNLVPGAVLEVVMQERNPLNVDQWKEFKVIKKAHEAPRKKENGEPITKIEDAWKIPVAQKLEKINQLVKEITEDLGL